MAGLIKFRVAAAEKRIFAEAAEKAGMSVSEMFRRAGRAAASGRIASRTVLTDLASIRSTANRLASLAETPDADPAMVIAAVKLAADDLHTIAARHLATAR